MQKDEIKKSLGSGKTANPVKVVYLYSKSTNNATY